VSWGKNRIDVFVRGMDDHLGHLWWNGSEWKGWQDLGGPITSAPAVASWGAHRLDVFAAGPDGNLERKSYDGSKWSDWDWIGGTFHDNPAAVSSSRASLAVVGSYDSLAVATYRRFDSPVNRYALLINRRYADRGQPTLRIG
jgi:hypothetical protein